MDEREATRDSEGYRDGEIKPVFSIVNLSMQKRW
jgi:hypothetical protein